MDGNTVNAVCVVENGQLVLYGTAGNKDGLPVYLFNTYADYEAAKENLKDPCMFITLDDLDLAGGGLTLDDALNIDSDNAVKNKAIAAAVNELIGETEILQDKIQQAKRYSILNYTPLRDGITWNNTTFANLGNICFFCLSAYFGNTRETADPATYYDLCTLDVAPGSIVVVPGMVTLSDNTTSINAEIKIDTSGNVSFRTNFDSSKYWVPYLFCNGLFLLNKNQDTTLQLYR